MPFAQPAAVAQVAAAPAAAERLPVPTWYWIVFGLGMVGLVLVNWLMSWQRLEIFKMLLASFFPLAVMIIAVLGSIVFGLATPTEAAAVGAFGGLLLAGQTLCVLEVLPAAYIVLAANEAEKAANITLINYTPRGRSGRLYFSGTDAEVRQARDAAVNAIEALPGRKPKGS